MEILRWIFPSWVWIWVWKPDPWFDRPVEWSIPQGKPRDYKPIPSNSDIWDATHTWWILLGLDLPHRYPPAHSLGHGDDSAAAREATHHGATPWDAEGWRGPGFAVWVSWWVASQVGSCGLNHMEIRAEFQSRTKGITSTTELYKHDWYTLPKAGIFQEFLWMWVPTRA